MKFTLIRHGETNWNRARKLIGRHNPKLNEKGLKEAQALVCHLRKNYDVIYCSPLKRARQTAEVIKKELNVPVVIKPELNVRSFGSLAGRTWRDIKQEQGRDLRILDIQQKYDYTPFGGECVQQVKKRVSTFIKQAKRSEYKRPIVVSHGDIVRAMLHMYRKKRVSNIKNLAVHSLDI